MSYRRLAPCVFIDNGKAVKWFDDKTVISEDVPALAKKYFDNGADVLVIFDLSDADEEHDLAIDIIKKITRMVSIPVIAGGNVNRLEDIKKILYAGAKHAIVNLSKPGAYDLLQEAAARFGQDRLIGSLNNFDELFKHRRQIEAYCAYLFFMHRLDVNSVASITDIPFLVLTDTMKQEEILKILRYKEVEGISGRFISQEGMDLMAFKELCKEEGITITSFESLMQFSEFKLNSDGLLPVVTQDFCTGEVLMVAYMNEDAFNHTVKSGKMTYYSRSRKERWVKGETSGHYQYVKSLTIDCDKDTLLAKVEQVGAACHTGNQTCFFQPIVGSDSTEKNPLQVFEDVYNTILDRKEHPKEGSYTNYLFDKGIDKILKKVGEEATEIIIAAKNPNPEEIKYEISDFLYHVMVLMAEKKVTWEDITKELANR